MSINTQQLRQYLQGFEFKSLFIEELGWNSAKGVNIPPIEVEGVIYTFAPIAQVGDMVVTECQASDGNIPDDAHRKKVDAHVTRVAFEHIIIFTDKSRTISRWRWVKHEKGKPDKAREQIYRQGQSGDLLMQKLVGIAFDLDELDEEGKVSIAMVTTRVARAFDVEKVTKKFYEQFQKEHKAFLEFLKGVQDIQGRDWYASVMLNRLMFLYFVQRKGFLNNDLDYLQTKLAESQGRGKDRFYRDFLLILFFDGLACEEGERTEDVQQLLGNIPYLNGGIFLPHQIEEANDNIQIADRAFENLFTFFDAWDWHLDDRPTSSQREINPDVLGYIFEKYINQKQMGAYYSKEDITDYICKNTVLPFLLDKIKLNVAQEIGSIDLYVYDSVSTDEHLPAESEYEYTARRKHYEQIITDFASDKISTVNDLITYNLDIRAFVEDWLRRLDAPIMLQRFYKALTELTILDPACGSGAFLFATMNILEPLYEACLTKMAQFLDDPKVAPQYHDFKSELERVDQHPNRRYFVFKSIIVNNLYGVDIMDEAIEICKLRLFLKLVAQVDDVQRIEPLPDIDFNIRAGNTLIGFATRSEIQDNLFARETLQQIDVLTGTLKTFREEQLHKGVHPETLKTLKANVRLASQQISKVLDSAISVSDNEEDIARYRASHKPFHWFAEFNAIMTKGGFDVIVGNPPYLELRLLTAYKVQSYQTAATKNLYAVMMERCMPLSIKAGRVGFIVPVSSISTEGYQALQKILFSYQFHACSFDDRPAKLFEGLEHIQLTIWLLQNRPANGSFRTTECMRWSTDEREYLFSRIQYQQVQSQYLLNCLPKISRDLEASILRKLWTERGNIGSSTDSAGNYQVFYSRKVHNFLQALDFVPQVYNGQGQLRPPSELKYLRFNSKARANITFCVLNSTLFRWFVNVFSDCRHVNKREVEGFRLDLDKAIGEDETLWGHLAIRLSNSLQETSEFRDMRFKHDTLRVQCIIPKFSKPIIDEIDRLLAQHYGFTDEELDFIINYDIKYRMGKDADEGGEDDVE